MAKSQPTTKTERARMVNDAIWLAVRNLKTFTASDIAARSGQALDKVEFYLDQLEAAQVILSTTKPDQRKLECDVGHHAPIFDRSGKPVKYGLARRNLWRSMRMLKQFKTQDLILHSTTDWVPVDASFADDYVRWLLKAGYLRVIVKAKPQKRISATYKLIQDTGANPPEVCRVMQVWDPNTEDYMIDLEPRS